LIICAPVVSLMETPARNLHAGLPLLLPSSSEKIAAADGPSVSHLVNHSFQPAAAAMPEKIDSVQVTTELPETGKIRAVPCPLCILCGGEGRQIYSEQPDRLFGAEGSWNLKRCANPVCGLVWLDPMPLTEDIGKAYANYYTHASRESAGRKGMMGRIFAAMQRAYLANKFNYTTGRSSFVTRCLGRLLYLFPIRRRGLDGDVRFLAARPGGRLLDVGCGSGDWLMFMRGLGWQVSGNDFDANAVKTAQGRGLDVECASLEQQKHPGGAFDAVTLSHVIEHVPDPVQTLAECRRILKPGGKLVLFTPNASSLSHRVFKNDWRGLEPPRHLHVFSTESMRPLLERAGFQNISIRPHLARSVVYESLLLRRGRTSAASQTGRSWSAEVYARLFNLVELCLIQWKPSVADCVAAVAVKE
jgi:2-polyprenyl-3-methyl-5-hydroxy-6-metoxy-1,4-benzoquinol methylase